MPRPYRRGSSGSSHITSRVHSEDQQPNEIIQKGQRSGPPPVVSASVAKYDRGRGVWRNHIPYMRGRGRGSSHYFPGRTQGRWIHNPRGGNRSWRASHWRGHNSQPHSSFNTSSPSTSLRISDVPQPSTSSGIDTKSRHSPSRPAAMLPPLTYNSLLSSNEGYSAHQASVSVGSETPSSVTDELRATSIHSPPSPLPTVQTSDTPFSSPLSLLVKDTTPPYKRRKLDHQSGTTVKSDEVEDPGQLTMVHHSLTLNSPEVVVKSESQSFSPPPSRLVTESCSFYPLPNNCRKINIDYLKNRNAFLAKEYGILKRFGLKAKKVLFRDDGMVIEWISPVPVWSDTLLPEQRKEGQDPVIPENTQRASIRYSSSGVDNCAGVDTPLPPSSSIAFPPPQSESQVIQSTPPPKFPLPRRRDKARNVDRPTDTSHDQFLPLTPVFTVPQKEKGKPSTYVPLPRRRLPTPKHPTQPELNPSHSNISIPPDHRPQSGIGLLEVEHQGTHPDVPVVQNHLDSVSAKPITHVWSAEELFKIEPMAVDYLRRYIQIFDMDRSTLVHAYSKDALFSYRIFSPKSVSSPLSPSSPINCGPSTIAGVLVSLGPYAFCPRGTAHDIYYDVVSLCQAAGGGILLTTHGRIINTSQEKSSSLPNPEEPNPSTYLIDQSFVLQKNEKSGTKSSNMDIWPLVAVSHQMIIRKVPNLQ